MTEVRHDPVSGVLSIVAESRGARPHTLASAPPDADRGTEHCPFCEGEEHRTPPEVSRTGGGEPGTPGWRVRVVPNLYPITEAHEVVVLSPGHDRGFADLTDDEAIEVFTVLRDRVRALTDAGFAYATAVLNHGRGAGASIAHPHAQVFALSFVPPAVADRVDRQLAARDDLVDADLSHARTHGLVVVDGTHGAAAWCAFASPSPLFVRVAIPGLRGAFARATDDATEACARGVRDVLARVRAVAGDPPYNLAVHSVPRWYVEITPRLGKPAGFEQVTGVMVNTVPPERAAALLRDARPDMAR